MICLFAILISGLIGMVCDFGYHIITPPVYWALGMFGGILAMRGDR